MFQHTQNQSALNSLTRHKEDWASLFWAKKRINLADGVNAVNQFGTRIVSKRNLAQVFAQMLQSLLQGGGDNDTTAGDSDSSSFLLE